VAVLVGFCCQRLAVVVYQAERRSPTLMQASNVFSEAAGQQCLDDSLCNSSFISEDSSRGEALAIIAIRRTPTVALTHAK